MGDMKKATYTLSIQFTNGGASYYHDITQARAYFLLKQAIARQSDNTDKKELHLNPDFYWGSIARWKISTGWQDFA